MITPRTIRLAIGFIGVTAIFVILISLPWDTLETSLNTLTGTQNASTTPPVFKTPTLQAKTAVVYDISRGTIIFGQQEQQVAPLASITKVMTALVSADYLTPTTRITITNEDLARGSNAGLEAGRTWTYTSLADFMMTTSSNGAARAIARQTEEVTSRPFTTLATEKAHALGLSSLTYKNETGLDEGGLPGASGSALDTAKLMAYTLQTKPELLGSTKWESVRRQTVDGAVAAGRNTNLIIRTIPGFLGSKTGFTDLAGGNLAVVFDAGLDRPVAVVVLGSTQEGRFTDVHTLIESTLEFLAH